MPIYHNSHYPMKNLMLALSFLLCATTSFSQQLDINKPTEEQKYIGKSSAGVIKIGNTLYRTEGHWKKKWELVAYDLKTAKRSVVRTLCEGKSKNGSVLPLTYTAKNFVELNGKYYILFIEKDIKAKIYNLHYQEMSSTGKPIGSIQLLEASTVKSKKEIDYFRWSTPTDNTKLMLWKISEHNGDGEMNLTYRLFQSDLSSPVTKNIKIPYSLGRVNIDCLNNGTVLFRGWEKVSEYTSNYRFVIANPETGDVKKILAEFPQYSAYNIVYHLNEDQTKMYVGGIIENKKEKKRDYQHRIGVFAGVCNIDTDKTIKLDYKKFSWDFINELNYDPRDKKTGEGNAVYQTMSFKNKIAHDDGSMTLLYECYKRHIIGQIEDSKGFKSDIACDFYKDIFSLKINANGNIHSINTLDKHQANDLGNEDIHCSFQSIAHNGKVYVIYGEDKERIEMKNTKFKKTSLYYSVLNKDNKFSAPKPLFPQSEGYAFTPSYAIYNNDETLFIPFISTSTSNSEYKNWNFKCQYATITVK